MKDLGTYIPIAISLFALALSFLSYRNAKKAQRLAGHDVMIDADVALGGRFEQPEHARPVVLSVRLMNRARGEVTIQNMHVEPSFPSPFFCLKLVERAMLSGPDFGHRLRGSDNAEWKFDLRASGKVLRGSWTSATEPRSSTDVRVVVSLGDGSSVDFLLPERSARIFWSSQISI